MATDDEGVLLSRGSVRRIKRVVDRFDGAGGGVSAPSGAAPYNPGVQRARVVMAIGSGSESSPATGGRVKLKVREASGAWVDGEEVDVYNDFAMPSSLPVGRMVRVAWIAGQWWLVSASCS